MGENSSYAQVLKNLIPVIRFPLMSSIEFASNVVPIQILSQKDVIDLFLYFNSESVLRQDAARKLAFSTVPRKGQDQVVFQLYEAADHNSLVNSSNKLRYNYGLQNVPTHTDILEITHKPAKSITTPTPRVLKLVSVVLQGLNYDALRSIWSQSHNAASTHQILVSVNARGTGSSSVSTLRSYARLFAFEDEAMYQPEGWRDPISATTQSQSLGNFQKECMISKGKETEVTISPSIEIKSNCKYQIEVEFQNVHAIKNLCGGGSEDSQRNRIDHMTNTTLKKSVAETITGGTFDVTITSTANASRGAYCTGGNTSTKSLHVVRGLKFVWE